MILYISFLLLLQSCIADEDGGDEDFVPEFFGGRRNEGEHSGMAPPHLYRPKTRSGPRAVVLTFNFTQKLDHFDKCNRRVWIQRYMVNDAYFLPRPNGPIFVRIGGEDEISEDGLQDGPLITLAREHKALVLSLEHRFYGESKPTPDLKTKNLRYLSSRQALWDLEAFIQSIKKQYEVSNPNAKVVLYGCSYAGSLAAYHRRLYSNSTVGAIAGFAPIFAVAGFDEYFAGVAQALLDESVDCKKQINDALYQLICLALNVTETDEDASACDEFDGLTLSERNMTLHNGIELCEPHQWDITNPHAIASMVYDFYARLMYIVQYNRKHLDGSSDLGTCCRYMNDTEKGQHAFERYGAWRKEIDGRCITHHGKSIQTLASAWDSNYVKAGTRQWLYQMCSEFGYFVGESVGLLNIRYFMQTCEKSFNINIDDLEANVQRTNELYGEEEVLNTTNIYFLSSEADPWFYANELRADLPIHPTMSIRVMKGISHCHEPIGDCSEERQLVDAWNDIERSVSSWIGKPKEGTGIFSVCFRQ